MSRRGRRRTAASLLMALGVLLGAAATPAPSRAQTPGQPGAQNAAPADDGGDARVTLAAIDPFAVSGTEVRWSVVIEHDGSAPWERIEVVAELHGALGSRSALRTALAGGAVPSALQRSVVDGPPLRPGGVARVTGSVSLLGRALTDATTAVHPLRLRVLADGSEVGRIDTAIVRVGSAPTERLVATLVWPLDAPPARGPDGDPSAVLDALTLRGGRLDTLVGAVAAVRTQGSAIGPLAPGIALAVPTHLVEDLALRGEGVPMGLVEDLLDGPPPADVPEPVEEEALRAALLLQRIRSTTLALPGAPLVTPYADADLGRILASSTALRPLAARAVLEGAGRVPLLLGREPSSVVLLDAPVAPSVLDLVPTRVVVIPHAAIEAPDLALDVPLGEPVRALRSPTGRVVTALVGDPYLTAALGTSTRAEPGDPVRAAHEVMVRSAMVHLEAPGRAGRTLVLLPPTGFDPDPRFAEELLARLAAAPWLEPTPAALLPVVTELLPEPALLRVQPADPLPARLARTLAATERDLALLVGAIDPEADLDEAVVAIGGRALRDASDELLRSTSRAFARDVDRAVALLGGVRAGVDGAFGAVRIGIDDVTLTDRDGTVPITLARFGGLPIRVRLEVTGPAALTWTDGRVRELTLGVDAERSIEIPVRSGGTGRFPVTVRVTDPSGERLLASETVGVRATALAGPALALIAVTVVALIVVGSVRQRRRGLAWRTDDDTADREDSDGEEVER
jgi:hypothetical protein